jgi:hypothetical protein
MVLWLAPAKSGDSQTIIDVYEPAQRVAADFFHIPPASMRELMQHLRNARLRIAAQVHSHPAQAFHSKADNEWAIVRHTGALSMVLPYFARGITPVTFLGASAVYRLSSSDKWEPVLRHELNEHLEIMEC